MRSSFFWKGAASAFVLCTASVSAMAGTGDCCSANGTPGCDDANCETNVCALDSFCCDTAWDTICADSACAICEVCVGQCGFGGECPPSDHDCCTTGAPGCTDIECCEAVCAADAFCCDTAWDGLCVDQVAVFCAEPCPPPECPPSDHDCYTAGGPGCTDAECCSAVCAIDDFCCEVAWDGLCVSSAFQLCGIPPCEFTCEGTDEGEPCGEDTNGGCNVPIIGDSNCCFANGGVGCDDPVCQEAVCLIDPFCCDVAWDGICAAEALDFCPDTCQLGKPSFGSISCGETICATAWADANFRDTDWYEITLTEATEITITVSSQLPMVFGVIDTGGVPDCSVATAINPFATTGFCGTGSVTACLGAGTWWIFAAPNGFTGFPCGGGAEQYSITLDCGGECVPPACGVPGTGDCFTANGTPFCEDEECCNIVCGIDPFCCDVAWDAICADEAAIFCIECILECPAGSVDEGEECGTDTNGGCNTSPSGPFGTIECGVTICGTAWADGNLRDTDWYEITFDTTTEVTFSATAEFPLVIGIVDTGGVPDCSVATALNPFATANPCAEASFTTCLAPGTYWFFVAPNAFAGFPCDPEGNNVYYATLTCGGKCTPPACGDPNSGDCFVANGTPFCNDAECCEAVCAVDPFCCDVSWDGLCANQALQICNAKPIENDDCDNAIAIGDGVTNFSTIGANTDGPALPPECDEGFGTGFVSDIWYTYQPSCDGTVTVSTCDSADYDTRLAVYTGECGALSLVACNDDGPGCGGFTSLLTFEAVCGETYVIRVGGFAGAGTGALTVSCAGDPCGADCPADLDGSGTVDGGDLGILLAAWGQPGPGDLDGSGTVDGGDLGILLAEWGPCD